MDVRARVVALFIGAGGLAGILSGVVRNGWAAAFLAFLFFYLAYRLAPRILRFQTSEFPPKKVVGKGFFPHFTVWLIVWIAVYNQLLVGALYELAVFLLVCFLGYLILLSRLQLPRAQPAQSSQQQ